MNTYLAPMPATYSVDVVQALTLAQFPAAAGTGLISVNGAANAALYTTDVADSAALASWRTAVTNHNPSTSTPASVAATLQQRAQAALTANATFQAIASPTNNQIAAQVQTLTKECNGVIRLLLGALDSTTGT